MANWRGAAWSLASDSRNRPIPRARECEKRCVIVYERVAVSFYSGRMLKPLGLPGAVRISPLHRHTPEDIEHFLPVTEEPAAC
ncbi:MULTISPECIES: hypothetical protein [Burkholderia]|uniref:hypothetical protein n=1 Tax=Burkholderia TaxID=32008 RepID=UPI00119BCE58|nr:MULTISPECIES: hypothetical protein [Burkholderia]MBJ9713139.1 hypothetical protein [Burkholderia gladioli]MBU9154513.1 hypothetical protein [Burkholderia gladioli]MBU9194124.1 hypothetical protein [Burkholderia gladioli]MBU9379061.1 hypothetical protein [Burkholderia gladioli]MBU9421459.1 hypothetical protein [Burkholderia gladioli]